MQTFKEVFRREEERQNLKSIGMCMLTVLALVLVAFTVVNMDFVFEVGRDFSSGWVSSSEGSP